MKSIVLLSGPIAAGKSSVASELVGGYGFRSIRTSPFLVSLAASSGSGTSRANLQDLGDRLDRDSDFRWVVDDVAAPALSSSPETRYWLLDCVRKQQQVLHFRTRFGNMVFHVHLTAPEDILEARYEARRAPLSDSECQPPYAAAILHANEIAARGLVAIADLVIELAKMSPQDAARQIVHRLNQGAANA